MIEMLSYGFAQRALLAALMVGLVAPNVGVFLVQRRLSLIGDGLGHMALVGVALGLLTGQAPVWMALVVVVLSSIAVELLRSSGRTGADVILAMMFYGGIAGGVVLVSSSEGGSLTSLNSYLFGAITTTSAEDLTIFAALAVLVLGTCAVLGRRLFAVSNDEEFARASGMPVLGYNLVLAVLTALTVVISMRVIGLLLISALMILPVAVAQQLAGSFRSTRLVASAVGVVVSLVGVMWSYQADTPPGGTIVLIAVGLFIVTLAGRTMLHRPLKEVAT